MDSQHPGVKCSTGDVSCGCSCSFHHHGYLTCHLNFCSGQPKVVEHILNVPVDIPYSTKLWQEKLW